MTAPSTLTSKGLSGLWPTSTGSLENSTWPANTRELTVGACRSMGLAFALSSAGGASSQTLRACLNPAPCRGGGPLTALCGRIGRK